MSPQQLLHALKKPVLRSSRVHRWLRRWILTPFQLREFRRLRKLLPVATEPVPSPRPRVLIVALRHWALSRAWEAVLTGYLREAGADVVWLHCDRTLHRCDSMMTSSLEPELCRHCVLFNKDVAEVLMVQTQSLADYVDESVQPNAADLQQEFGTVHASFQRLLGRRVPNELTHEQETIQSELLANAHRIREAAVRLLREDPPDTIVALNGKFFSERAIIEEAQKLSVPVWTYERGSRKDSIILSATPTAVPFDASSILERIDEPLSVEEERTLDEYLAYRRAAGNGQVAFSVQGRTRDLGVLSNRARTYALFTNLIWDSAVVGEDTIFNDMFDWVESVIESMDDSDAQLIIRVHPAETRVYWHTTTERTADVLRDRFPRGLPGNVLLIGPDDPVDTYDLIASSDLVLTYTSTVGLEAACMGRRVIVAAHSNYSLAPFVETPDTRSEYFAAVHNEGVVAPTDTSTLARRFAYRLYFERMIDVPYVAENPTGFIATRNRSSDGAMRAQAFAIVHTAQETLST